MPKSKSLKLGKMLNTELLVVWISERSNFEHLGFKEHGLKTEHSFSTKKPK